MVKSKSGKNTGGLGTARPGKPLPATTTRTDAVQLQETRLSPGFDQVPPAHHGIVPWAPGLHSSDLSSDPLPREPPHPRETSEHPNASETPSARLTGAASRDAASAAQSSSLAAPAHYSSDIRSPLSTPPVRAGAAASRPLLCPLSVCTRVFSTACPLLAKRARCWGAADGQWILTEVLQGCDLAWPGSGPFQPCLG